MKSVLLVAIFSISLNVFAKPVDPEFKNCKLRPPNMAESLNAVILGIKVEEKVQELIKQERAKGNNPKIFIVGRVGQDVDGVVTLKNYGPVCEQMIGMKCAKSSQPKWLSVHDIYNDKRIYDGSLSSVVSDTNKMMEVKSGIEKYYGDKSRHVLYSHVGFLFLDHAVLKNPNAIGGRIVSDSIREKLETGDVEEDQLFVEEMLKRCDPKDFVPYSFLTPIATFFHDNPQEYKSIIMVPDQKVQDRIYDLMINQGRRKDFLGKRYNAATGFMNQTEQNSNQYILELLAAAARPNINNRIEAIKVLKEMNYRPTMLLGTGFKISFANTPLAPAEFKLKKSENPYLDLLMAEIVTELSIREWGLRTGVIKSIHEVEIPKNKVIEQVHGIEYVN